MTVSILGGGGGKGIGCNSRGRGEASDAAVTVC